MAYLFLALVPVIYFPFKIFEKSASIGLTKLSFITKYNLLRHFAGIFAGIVILFTASGRIHFDFYTILTSLMYGVILIMCVYLGTYSYQITTVAITSLFASASLIVPIIFGVIFLGEAITIGLLLAILLFFVSIYLITGNDEKTEQRFTLKTFGVLFAFLLVSGLGSVAQQLFAMKVENGNPAMFMVLAYVFATIILFAFMLLLPKSDTMAKMPKKSILFGVLASVVGFVLQQISTYLVDKVSAAVLFSVMNGTGVIVAAIVGAIFYREKLTVKNTTGILLGIISLMLINFL